MTDHGKYEQNPIAAAFAAETGCGIAVYPGEEMHSPGAAGKVFLYFTTIA